MLRWLCVFPLVLAAGCVTSAEVVREKDEGTARRYPVSTDQAWEIAKTVFRWGGAVRIEEHRAEGYILASDTDDSRAEGTVMVAWVERDLDGVTRVSVRTRTRMLLNPAALLTEEGFHRRFVQAVAIVKDGRPLPAQPPD